MTEPTSAAAPDAHILPVDDTVDEAVPEQTDNSVKPEDGEQDVNQDPAPVPGSPA